MLVTLPSTFLQEVVVATMRVFRSLSLVTFFLLSVEWTADALTSPVTSQTKGNVYVSPQVRPFQPWRQVTSGFRQRALCMQASETEQEEEEGVIELADDEQPSTSRKPEDPSKAVAPFLSQGDISPNALNPDLSDPKQTRVIIYIILSLLPVLFLIPFMLGSRDLIPLDVLPPVEM